MMSLTLWLAHKTVHHRRRRLSFCIAWLSGAPIRLRIFGKAVFRYLSVCTLDLVLDDVNEEMRRMMMMMKMTFR